MSTYCIPIMSQVLCKALRTTNLLVIAPAFKMLSIKLENQMNKQKFSKENKKYSDRVKYVILQECKEIAQA